MDSYQAIVVGINYTNACRQALWQAHRLAKESGAKLHAIHVIPSLYFEEFTSFYEINRESIISTSYSSLEAFVTDVLGANHHTSYTIAEGTPHHEVITHANETGADLLVLGTDEYSQKPRRSGQFAIRCLRFVQMPVLIVRHQPTRPFGKLSACIDFSTSTIPVIKNAALINNHQKHHIEIIHASTPPWLRPFRIHYQPEVFEDKELKEQYHEILAGQIQFIQESTADEFENAPEFVQLEHEDPDIALLEHLENTQTELTIIGRSGSGAKGLKTDLLGSTAETLIRHAHCSLLVIPVFT